MLGSGADATGPAAAPVSDLIAYQNNQFVSVWDGVNQMLGGRREGAGRKPGARNKRTVEVLAAAEPQLAVHLRPVRNRSLVGRHSGWRRIQPVDAAAFLTAGKAAG
jgi:hypothetical protein